MKNRSHITIKNPCSQNWQAMPITEGGKFCDHCQKKVIDFTQKSEEEIKQIISNSSSSICGRLKEDNFRKVITSASNKSYALGPFRLLTFSMIFSTLNSFANQCITTISPKSYTPTVTTNSSLPNDTTGQQISGIVLDATTKEPLQGVTVYLKGTSRGTSSNGNGYFELPLSHKYLKAEMTFIFQYVGMLPQEISVKQHDLPKQVKIMLCEDTNVLIGEVVVLNHKRKRWPFKWFHFRK